MDFCEILAEDLIDWHISVRTAQQTDYPFVRSIYLEPAERLLNALGAWDEKRLVMRLDKAFRLNRGLILSSADKNIGWTQILRTPQGLHLNNIHLVEAFRGRGVGTRVIQAVIDSARAKQMPLTLHMLKGNRAISLYNRLGFRGVSEDQEKIHMRWMAE
jgi:ribosomal protein S18 acetylase RimI-like enzyme